MGRGLRPRVTQPVKICDVIKQNQSEVGNIDLKKEPNKAENVVCFLLFLASFTVHIFGTNQPISMEL